MDIESKLKNMKIDTENNNKQIYDQINEMDAERRRLGIDAASLTPDKKWGDRFELFRPIQRPALHKRYISS